MYRLVCSSSTLDHEMEFRSMQRRFRNVIREIAWQSIYSWKLDQHNAYLEAWWLISQKFLVYTISIVLVIP